MGASPLDTLFNLSHLIFLLPWLLYVVCGIFFLLFLFTFFRFLPQSGVLYNLNLISLLLLLVLLYKKEQWPPSSISLYHL